MAAPHFCHVFSTFDPGGAEVRTVQILNALGPAVKHTIIATNGRYGATERIHNHVSFDIVPPPPGKGGILYALALSRTLQAIKPDLLLTYNWGAIDAVIAAVAKPLCPVLHAEDGFGPEEAVTLKRRRTWTRRVFLNRIFGTVVPSKVLLSIALTQFGLKKQKVSYIPNGVDHYRFTPERTSSWRRAHAIPDDGLLVGSVGSLRAEKNYGLLIEAVRRMDRPNVWLAFAGDGPCRPQLELIAREVGLASRVLFAGAMADPVPFYQSLDVFGLSSMTEQMPLSVLEAMACGLPVVSTDVGDVRDMLGPAAHTQDTLVPPGDTGAYASALAGIVGNVEKRRELGRQNRARCLECYTQDRMFRAYREIYQAALKSSGSARLRDDDGQNCY